MSEPEEGPGAGPARGPAAGSWVRREILRVERGAGRGDADRLAAEEPMEIRVLAERGGRLARHPIAVTMRTPGRDFELALGFLYTEGALAGRQAVARVAYCEAERSEAGDHVVEVTLAPGQPFDPERFTRHVYTTSSCGVCGKASLELLRAAHPEPPRGDFRLDPQRLVELPARLAEAQTAFAVTGGLHAAGLFDPEGRLVALREDVGRHNAVDKLVGALLLDDALPARDTLLLVSGRASFELVEKSIVAGIPALAAVGAPSSLAVDTAEAYGSTLIGFLRDGRFNVYAGAGRIALG